MLALGGEYRGNKRESVVNQEEKGELYPDTLKLVLSVKAHRGVFDSAALHPPRDKGELRFPGRAVARNVLRVDRVAYAVLEKFTPSR